MIEDLFGLCNMQQFFKEVLAFNFIVKEIKTHDCLLLKLD